MSRDSCPQFGIVPFIKSESQKPGPGAYTPLIPKTGIVPTFHIRTLIPKSLNIDIGPGKYNIPSSIQPYQPIMNSRFRSTKSTKFAPLKEDRKSARDENEQSTLKTGLGMIFDKSHQINKTGVFFNSKYKNSMCRYFGKFQRNMMDKLNDNPGPGSYKYPSEFGFYESSKASKIR